MSSNTTRATVVRITAAVAPGGRRELELEDEDQRRTILSEPEWSPEPLATGDVVWVTEGPNGVRVSRIDKEAK
jgi:hypothetical protein